MITRDEIKDEVSARREELMARAEELKDRFAENMTEETVSAVAGYTLLSAGIAVGVTMWLKGRRSFAMMLAPVGLIAVGVYLLGNTAWHVRGTRILEAEARVRDELAALDPIARLQVIRDVAPSSTPFVRHARN